MKSSTLLKTDNPYSNYNECVVIFKQLKRQLDIAMCEVVNPICNIKQTPKRNKFLNISMKIILLFGLLSFYGCAKAQLDKETVYTIKKGEYYSDAKHKVIANKLKYQIKFDQSAVYKIDSVNQYDINKLFGFNGCYATHDYISARFGWNYVNDSVKIYYYIYDHGKRIYGYLTSVNINEFYTYELIQTTKDYTFKIKDITYVHKKSTKCLAQFNYHLWPYFGGNIPAPHEVKIYFKNAK